MITFGWISNILRVQYQILDYSLGLPLRIIIKAVSSSKGLFAYIATGLVIGIMLYVTPVFSFGFLVETIGMTNAVNGALILFIVQSVSVRKKENTD